MYEMATRSSRRIAAAQASAQIQQWINESDDQEEEMSSDDEFGVESETEDVVEYQRSEPDTASCSSSEEESESIVPSSDSLLSRDKTITWSKTALAAVQGRRSSINVVRTPRGIVIGDKVLDSPPDSVHLYLDDEFFYMLLKFTNEELKRRREAKINADTHYNRDFDLVELKAAVGLLILIGVMSGKRESLEQMWSEGTGSLDQRCL